MAGRRRTNPNNPRAEQPARLRQPEFRADTSLGREASAVLAVLVLASYWPGRFRDRWVTADDFGNHSRDLPKPRDGDISRRDTLRALVRRGLGGLKTALPDDTIERESVGVAAPTKDPREKATRLRYTPSPVLEGWFARQGLEHLDPETRKAFREQSYGALGTVEEFKKALEEALIYGLLERGAYDSTKQAAARASTALANATTAHDRRVFGFALAQAEGRSGDGGQVRALTMLRALAAEPGPHRSPSEYLLQGRILIALARALCSEQRAKDDIDLTEARRCLSTARDLVPMDSYFERGELSMVEASIEGIEANWCSRNGAPLDDVTRHRDNAELAVLAAVNSWRLVRRWDRVRDGIIQLRRMPGEFKEHTMDAGRAMILIPWLDTLVRYQDAETGLPWRDGTPKPYHLGAHLLHDEILEAFNALPPDIPPSALPIPADEAYELVMRCIRAFRNDEFYDSPADVLEPEEADLPIEHAAWFKALRQKEEARRG